MKNIIALGTALILITTPVSAKDTKTEVAKAGGAAAAGALVGGATFAGTGSICVAVGGTALSIGAAPFVAAGAVIGLAGYGIYRIFK